MNQKSCENVDKSKRKHDDVDDYDENLLPFKKRARFLCFNKMSTTDQSESSSAGAQNDDRREEVRSEITPVERIPSATTTYNPVVAAGSMSLLAMRNSTGDDELVGDHDRKESADKMEEEIENNEGGCGGGDDKKDGGSSSVADHEGGRGKSSTPPPAGVESLQQQGDHSNDGGSTTVADDGKLADGIIMEVIDYEGGHDGICEQRKAEKEKGGEVDDDHDHIVSSEIMQLEDAVGPPANVEGISTTDHPSPADATLMASMNSENKQGDTDDHQELGQIDHAMEAYVDNEIKSDQSSAGEEEKGDQGIQLVEENAASIIINHAEDCSIIALDDVLQVHEADPVTNLDQGSTNHSLGGDGEQGQVAALVESAGGDEKNRSISELGGGEEGNSNINAADVVDNGKQDHQADTTVEFKVYKRRRGRSETESHEEGEVSGYENIRKSEPAGEEMEIDEDKKAVDDVVSTMVQDEGCGKDAKQVDEEADFVTKHQGSSTEHSHTDSLGDDTGPSGTTDQMDYHRPRPTRTPKKPNWMKDYIRYY